MASYIYTSYIIHIPILNTCINLHEINYRTNPTILNFAIMLSIIKILLYQSLLSKYYKIL